MSPARRSGPRRATTFGRVLRPRLAACIPGRLVRRSFLRRGFSIPYHWAVNAERREMRRGVSLDCEVLAELWDEPVLLRSRDLSPRGVWLETELPLEPGDMLWVSLTLPDGTQLETEGVVRRSEFRGEAASPSGMAIEFLGCEGQPLLSIGQTFEGLPPPLPAKPDPFRKQERMEEITVKVTYQEWFGDRVNSYEVSERVGLIVDDEPEFTAMGTLLGSSDEEDIEPPQVLSA